MQAKDSSYEPLTKYWQRLEQLLSAIEKVYPLGKYAIKDEEYQNAREKLSQAAELGKKLEQTSSNGILSIFSKNDVKKIIEQIDYSFDNLSTTFTDLSGNFEIKSAAYYTLAYHYLPFITVYFLNHCPVEKSQSELKYFWQKKLRA
jgi:hypothetical protein